MTSSKKVYIAGPYSGRDEPAEDAVEAMAAGVELIERGHYPFIPHLYHFMNMVSPQGYEVWAEQEVAWLRECDALVLVDPSCEDDVQAAESFGIPVYADLAAFFDAHPAS